MKKVFNITIGGVVFKVEEDAYLRLSKYLESIANYFKKDDEREEIVEDIEVSIAEKLSGLKLGERRAVTMENVEKVMEEMGSVKDFKEFADEDVEESVPLREKKLYRDTDDQIIGGVASGLAAYLGLEVVIVRLLFFLSFLLGGIGFILYLFLWVVVEPAKTTAQKLHMRGERITLKEIEKSVKLGVENLKKKDLKGAGATFDKFFRKLAGFVQLLGKFFIKLFAVAFTFAGVAGLAALSFAVAWLFSGAVIPFNGVILWEVLSLDGYRLAIFNFAFFATLFVPLVLTLGLGVSILKKRVQIGNAMLAFLIVLWFVSVSYLAAISFQNLESIQSMINDFEPFFECRGVRGWL